MRSNPSKPSSDAGLHPIGDSLPIGCITPASTGRESAKAMLYINLRTVEITCGSWVSLEINREGIFFFVCPFELAVLWPWTKL